MKNVEVIVDPKGVRKLRVSFSLWNNKDKQPNSKQPDRKGFDKESGVSASGWLKEHNGERFLSGSIEIPLSSLPASVMDEFVATPPPSVDLNDDIPF